MKIFTPCWGIKHIGLFEHSLARSLSWPRNAKSIENSEWIVLSESQEEVNQIAEIIGRLFPTAKVTAFLGPDIAKSDYGMSLIAPLKALMEMCIQDKSPLLMATPDFIFGDGTIEAFKRVGLDEDSCVSIAHMRVLPEILPYLNSIPPDNAYLMRLGLAHPHASWVGSEVGCKDTRFWNGGIQWRNLGNRVFTVQHYMPSPFYVNFIEKDLESFSEFHDGKHPGFGMWDHAWPTKLIESGRLRYIGSSDAALLLEVTDSDKNVPGFNKPTDPYGFFRNKLHNHIQKQFISVFRGE